ncbi:uncharacterized protein SCODWIG_03791 [Saccharomycodes ludwigii]|uniref:Uncharacterized protein n=1 Tax=Saccharomycodes ludwigii TaxID=36035 RepID=A0A376BBR3_9ASCO|nr:hypothetical protein SCDLUD_001011 [Saccharomycodes ludwigii]KAH3903379.1 hypothetical protein SCDLUD_001011 [Saccharomycodes ludwigii]SSD62029.1 uncharacterized protein SCODWIG_03791 [Saccharomycodes ludwigii]
MTQESFTVLLTKENEQLLNKLVLQITLKLQKPIMEFMDILIESFMYPRGVEASLLSKILNYTDNNPKEAKTDKLMLSITRKQASLCEKYECNDLGNFSLLEILHIKKLLLESGKNTAYDDSLEKKDKSYSTVKKSMDKIHIAIVYLLRNLSTYLEIPTCFSFFKKILHDNMGNFETCFKLFKLYNVIVDLLIDAANRGGVNNSALFQVTNDDLELIESFSKDISLWMETMLFNSTAFQDYKEQDIFASNSVCKSVSVVLTESFEKFLTSRKQLLRISARTI